MTRWPREPLAVVVAISLATVACARLGGSEPRSAEDPEKRLKEAVSATLALRSFRMTSEGEGGEAGLPPEPTMVFDYVAPDRLREVTRQEAASSATDLIAIDGSIYMSLPDRPGFFHRASDPSRASVEAFLSLLENLLRVEDVEGEGATFTFVFSAESTTGTPPGKGEARIADGLLARLALTYSEGFGSIAYSFSNFDSVPPVNRPPADRIVPYDTGIPPCDSEGLPGDVILCEPGPGES